MRTPDQWWEDYGSRRRIDLNLGNLCMLLGLIVPSISIVLNGPATSTTLANMPLGLQTAMCACILIGCSMKLHGALSGRRFWFPNTPLKRSYTYGFSGAPIAFVGCVTYGWYIMSAVDNAWSAMSSIGILLFGIGIQAQAALYLLEYRRINRNEMRLRQQAVNKLFTDTE